MTEEEKKTKAKQRLKKVPQLRRDIIQLNYEIKADPGNKKLIRQKEQKTNELNYIIDIISTLPKQDQQIICYKYFDGIKSVHIANMIGIHYRTIYRRLKENILPQIGGSAVGYGIKVKPIMD